jgi:hypothetical protein
MNIINRFLSRPVALAAVALNLSLGVSSCATSARVGVSNDFDHSVNFRAYKTWSWYPQQGQDTEGGPAKGYESFLDQRIRAAVVREMAAKGLTEVKQGADVFVAYTAKVENKQRVNSSYSPYGYPYGYGYGYYGRGMAPVTEYKAGTVIIDIVDAKRKELAWRGTGVAQLDQNTITEPETFRIVNSILGTYPPQDNNQARR